MKMFCLGVSHNKGISYKKNPAGVSYDIQTLLVAMQIEPRVSKDGNFDGFGFQQAELPLADGAIEKFRGVKFPCELELQTDNRLRFGRMETVVLAPAVSPVALGPVRTGTTG